MTKKDTKQRRKYTKQRRKGTKQRRKDTKQRRKGTKQRRKDTKRKRKQKGGVALTAAAGSIVWTEYLTKIAILITAIAMNIGIIKADENTPIIGSLLRPLSETEIQMKEQAKQQKRSAVDRMKELKMQAKMQMQPQEPVYQAYAAPAPAVAAPESENPLQGALAEKKEQAAEKAKEKAIAAFQGKAKEKAAAKAKNEAAEKAKKEAAAAAKKKAAAQKAAKGFKRKKKK